MSRLALVVDDNKSDQMILSALLEREGFSVATASNGHDALEILDEEKIDLIIVDIQMPFMSGMELLKRIRKIENYRKTPIVSSGRKDESDIRMARANGANDYIVKPVDREIFENKLKSVFGSSQGWKLYSLQEESKFSEITVEKTVQLKQVSEIEAVLEASEAYEKGMTMSVSGKRTK